jgi:hypothetical protein
VAFGSLFSDVEIERRDNDGTLVQTLKVPIAQAPKEKWIVRIDSDQTLENHTYVTLPRMSFEMSGLTYDTTRKQNTNVKSFAKTSTGTIAQYNPVPYNFDFNLYIYVRNIEDGTQIIEHILPFFTPDYTVKLNLIPEMGIVKEVPVILNSSSHEIDYEGNKETETRMVIWTLNFTVKGFIFGKTSSTSLIKHSITNILNNITTNDLVQFEMAANGLGTYQEGEIVYQGYSVNNAQATAKVIFWNNNTLQLTNINGNFVSDAPIIGVISNSNYTFVNYQVVPKKLATINITPSPTDANTNTAYTHTTTIMETPNIENNLTLSSSFDGDAMIQIGTDDLLSQQQNITDLQ